MQSSIPFRGAAFTTLLALAPAFPQAPSSVPQADKNEIEARLSEDRLDRARRDLRTLIAKVESASNTLKDMETRAPAFDKRMTELLTHDDGKRIAQDFAAANTILRLREQPFAHSADITSKSKAAQSLLTLLAAEEKTPNVGYQPSEKTVIEVEDLYDWSRTRSDELAKREATLQDIIAKAPATTPPPNAPMLGQVLDAFVSARIRLWAELIQKGEEIGREQTKPVMIETARLAELERTESKLQDLMVQAKIDADRIRQDYEDRLKRARDEERIQLAKADARAKDLEAELDSLKKATDAARHEKKVEADAASGKVMDAAEHDRKKALAQSTTVRELLKPFTTPGYYQINKKASYDRQPVSLKELQASGALDASPQGLNKLLVIGLDGGDKERPRFGYPNAWKKLSPQQKDELKAIQNHLIDLGEVMVELGMLAP